jgi:hypothetical protein
LKGIHGGTVSPSFADASIAEQQHKKATNVLSIASVVYQNAILRATQKPKRVILCPIRLEGERDSSGGKTRPDYSVEEDRHKCDLIAPTP